MSLYILRDDYTRQFSKRPNMTGRAEVNRLIQRSALDTDRLLPVPIAVPQPRPAPRAKEAIEDLTTVGGPRPALEFAMDQAHVGGAHDYGDAESRCGLLTAFAAVADVDFQRNRCDLVTDVATLASAGHRASVLH